MTRVRNVSVDWDVPVPEGAGRSIFWRGVRSALNTMYTEHKPQVRFTVPLEKGTAVEDAEHIGELVRATYYAWRYALGRQVPKELVPNWSTAYRVFEDRVEVHVFDVDRATFAK